MLHKFAEAKLLAGYIYGDNRTKEYIYLPGSELDAAHPMPVYEKESGREDITLKDALKIIEKRSLRPVIHPIFGKRTI